MSATDEKVLSLRVAAKAESDDSQEKEVKLVSNRKSLMTEKALSLRVAAKAESDDSQEKEVKLVSNRKSLMTEKALSLRVAAKAESGHEGREGAKPRVGVEADNES